LDGVAEVVVAEDSDARSGTVVVGYQSTRARVSGGDVCGGDVTSCGGGWGDVTSISWGDITSSWGDVTCCWGDIISSWGDVTSCWGDVTGGSGWGKGDGRSSNSAGGWCDGTGGGSRGSGSRSGRRRRNNRNVVLSVLNL